MQTTWKYICKRAKKNYMRRHKYWIKRHSEDWSTWGVRSRPYRRVNLISTMGRSQHDESGRFATLRQERAPWLCGVVSENWLRIAASSRGWARLCQAIAMECMLCVDRTAKINSMKKHATEQKIETSAWKRRKACESLRKRRWRNETAKNSESSRKDMKRQERIRRKRWRNEAAKNSESSRKDMKQQGRRWTNVKRKERMKENRKWQDESEIQKII